MNVIVFGWVGSCYECKSPMKLMWCGSWRWLDKEKNGEWGNGAENEEKREEGVERSWVHLFSFAVPQSEESPAGGPRSLICYP